MNQLAFEPATRIVGSVVHETDGGLLPGVSLSSFPGTKAGIEQLR
ncbi:hypothetical protein ACGFZB_25765 [Streptomyces cinerochromogenes]|uniref:Uncharacterized protein n=1 Tax=Streptomyces cinerochromogenes TaxID=66422 RepID=A0ABW7B9B2_9ACTN